ncbi:DUF1109 domain-containing protein [Amaricoccus sp.]|uniref:DUF1109 domain-containing protein n=1 Tax=Amaricoccus sp. TaxID=1872485 RepID=UPI001B7A48D2|nr:DUF1109 domain-containing protein [Amaricoccus sp.]MBP7242818.1 DUF1109 domain-containing protein [Amaricoccus sp.]
MRTEALVRAMAADAGPVRPMWRALLAAVLAATVAAGGLFLLAIGPRPDLGAALMRPDPALKQLFVVASALAAFGASLRLARPEVAAPGGWGWALLAAPALAVAAFWATAAGTPVALWPTRVAGHGILPCFAGIGAIGLPILVATLGALRRGAPARPGLAGAVGGLLAGSAGACVYALYCTDDSPMFWGVWYAVALLAMTATGWLLGRRVLRW